jgi:hypothetical protein
MSSYSTSTAKGSAGPVSCADVGSSPGPARRRRPVLLRRRIGWTPRSKQLGRTARRFAATAPASTVCIRLTAHARSRPSPSATIRRRRRSVSPEKRLACFRSIWTLEKSTGRGGSEASATSGARRVNDDPRRMDLFLDPRWLLRRCPHLVRRHEMEEDEEVSNSTVDLALAIGLGVLFASCGIALILLAVSITRKEK